MHRILLLVCALALAWFADARAEPATLLSTPAANGGRLDVVIGGCDAEACELMVELRDEAGAVARHATGWALPNLAPVRDDSAAAREILVSAGAPAAAWTFGEEASWTVIAARHVRLAGDGEGLLLMHMGGFEHVKRSFQLVVIDRGGVRNLWTGGDGPGPQVSWMEIDTRSGADDLVFFRAFLHPDPVELETLTASRLSGGAGGVTEVPARDLWAVVAGGYADAAAARQARDARNGAPFLALAPDMLARRSDAPVVLAAVTAFEPRARAWRREARRNGFPRARLTRAGF
ncbi:MAG: hypothetical protein AB7Q23_02660 [Hyphomonadaceae bacterium]